jgi:uncharacterized protein YuzE
MGDSLMPQKMELELKGPFAYLGEGGKTIFEIPENQLHGLYFFTIKVGNRYLISYLGETSRDYLARFMEHTEKILSGKYQIYDAVLLQKGESFPIWRGQYGKNKEKDYVKFLNCYDKYSQMAYQELKLYQIFLLPVEDKRFALRIEGALYKILESSKDSQVREFIEKGIKRSERTDIEDEILIEIQPTGKLAGVPIQFRV